MTDLGYPMATLMALDSQTKRVVIGDSGWSWLHHLGKAINNDNAGFDEDADLGFVFNMVVGFVSSGDRLCH